MARAIDADVIMKKIREYMEDFPNAGTRLAVCRVFLSMLGDENQIPTLTPPNEWVSVEERLPEDDTDVLMWRKKWEIVEAGTYCRGHFWVYDEIGDSYIADDITHWMPTPEPPDRRPPEGEEDT